MAVAGCGGEVAEPPRRVFQQWESVSLKRSCGTTPARTCRGFIPFTISRDGEYALGPGAGRRAIRGRVSEAELASLDLVVGEAASADLRKAPSCSGRRGTAGFTETVLLTLLGGEVFEVFDEDGREVCFRGRSSDTHRLALEVASLAKRYSPLPYP